MEALSLSRRWITFNGVGLLGLGLQLGAVALLVHGFGVPYMAATVIAVEAAILHNFVWHQRWTFNRRGPAVARRTILKRLIRFHLLNGTVSLVGNVIIMGGLTGILGMEPVAANLVAVLACSIVNFFACDMLVFRTTVALLAVLVFSATTNASGSPEIPAAELRSPTLAAWQEYERKVDERYGRLAGSGTFFAHDEYKRSAQWRAAARAGNIGMFQIESAAPGAPQPQVPDGKIHHWAGAVFIPGATLDGVLRRLRENAGREAGAYEDVLASRLLSSEGDRLQVFLKLRREVSLVSVTYNTEHAIEYRRLGSNRASSRSVATRIAELTGEGSGREREKPPGKDSGYLWRLNAYWRYEQVDGGVLLECESVSLSRSVPFVLRPFITGKDPAQPAHGARPLYLKRSSNAFRALGGPEDVVSRSTVVRGSYRLHVFRTSLGETRAGTGFRHSNGALLSK
jgi:putative flippase GtrA